VAVYLQNGSSPNNIRTVPYLKLEVEALMQSAGYKVEWNIPGQPVDDGVLVVVDLRGSCSVSGANSLVKPVKNGASLASTAVEGDQVLPFSWISCETLTGLLAPSLAGIASAERDSLYGRAMGRILAHELYHILANEREHSQSGVGKSSFTASDVLGENFLFEGSALASLTREPNPPDAPTSAEDADQ